MVIIIIYNILYFLWVFVEVFIGEECYGMFVYDFNIIDSECFKYVLFKGLGFGIVVGGSIVKIF